MTDLEFTFERRRYGERSFYTWAYVKAPDGEWVSLGDPWPGVHWPKAELEKEARERLAARKETK